MINYSLLAPGAVLALWTLVMLLWMAATRFQAMAKIKMDIKSGPPGGRGQDLEALLPPEVNWKSHNYTHLHEQPTLFYAIITFLTLSGGVNEYTLYLAWGYTALRIIHSLYQATINKVAVRFGIFLISTVLLFTLALMAVISTLG